MNKKYFLLLLLLNLGVMLHAQTRVIEIKKLNNYEPVGDQSKADPVTILRKSQQDSIVLEFGKGGTQTDIYFYGPDSGKDHFSNRKSYPVNLHGRAFGGMENPSPLINITGIPDGVYHASMSSCGFYGGITITVITKE